MYCSDSLFVKCVVNVKKTLKQTKLHPGDSQLHAAPSPQLLQGDTKVPPLMLDVIIRKTFCQVDSDQKQVTSDWL